jgi:hypothetical protein
VYNTGYHTCDGLNESAFAYGYRLGSKEHEHDDTCIDCKALQEDARSELKCYGQHVDDLSGRCRRCLFPLSLVIP